MNVRTWSNH